jgi:UDP-N-acetyl-D-mannosaminuronic acid dehydrogenase
LWTETMTSPVLQKERSANRRQSTASAIGVTVVGGAGHVGLPLALLFADSGQRVMIYDISENALTTIGKGKLPAIEHGAQELLERALAEDRLVLTSDPADIPDSGAIIVTIGTPVDEFLNPIHKEVKSCIDALLPQIADGQLLVLRSTVFPGTTDWLHRYIRDQGRRVLVAFCPERVTQGNAIEEVRSMPQIISGTTQDAQDKAAQLFSLIAPELVCVKPLEAEFAKLFTNAYRYVQFAVSNQFYMMAERADVNYFAVIDAMTRNYPRMRGFPTSGFTAGPCLFKDTMQLAAYSENQFSLGHAAMLVNEGLMLFIVERLEQEFDLSSCTVGLLGTAFKADVDDTRSSLSYKLKKLLAIKARAVLTTDPVVIADPDLRPLEEVVEQSDVLVLCTPHTAYRNVDLRGKPVLDVWGFYGARKS